MATPTRLILRASALSPGVDFTEEEKQRRERAAAAVLERFQKRCGNAQPMFAGFDDLLDCCPELGKFYVCPGVEGFTMKAMMKVLRGLAADKAGDGSFDVYLEPESVHPPSRPADPHRVQQNYLDAAPLGIDHDTVADNPAVRDVRLAVVEQGWNLEHEELLNGPFQLVWGESHRFHGHGTSILGILAASGRNGIGGAGIVPPRVKILLASEFEPVPGQPQPRYSTARAIAGAITNGELECGDILLIESQVRTPEGLLLPAEADPAVRAIIDCAAAKYGIVFIEAAGNGGILLDSYTRFNTATCLLERPFGSGAKKSKAIIVGAASADPTHAPLFFTNRGSHVRCFAWGEDVTTCGDGSTSKAPDDYLSDFSGTSAAAAIVAGVAAVVQSIAREFVAPDDLVAALTDDRFGTTTLESAGIGVMPDLEKLAAKFAPRCVPDPELEPAPKPKPKPMCEPDPAPSPPPAGGGPGTPPPPPTR